MIKRFLLALVLTVSILSSLTTSTTNAQPAVPIDTSSTSYGSYEPGTSWLTNLTPAQRCTSTQKLYIAKPKAAGTYPVVIYLHGTYGDWSGNVEGQQFAQRAASQGFVAVALSYNSSSTLKESGLARHAYCMFNQTHTGDALTATCAIAGANCSKGVSVAGFSQGAAIAVIAKNYSSRVTAVWGIGLSAYIYPSYKVPTNAVRGTGGTRVLPDDKLVINMGQSSNLVKKNLLSQDMPSLKKFTGKDCGTGYNCLQSNGSGYYIVQNAEVADKTADHCYWQQATTFSFGLSCTLFPTKFDPNFELASASQWSMQRNLNWLRSQL